MIDIPINTNLSSKFKDLIDIFNDLEYYMNAGNAVGSEYYRPVLAKFEQELIMRGFI
mgnify:FL=1